MSDYDISEGAKHIPVAPVLSVFKLFDLFIFVVFVVHQKSSVQHQFVLLLITFCRNTLDKVSVLQGLEIQSRIPSSTTRRLFDFPCTIVSRSLRFADNSTTLSS
jgi:hypothetical protein